MTNTELIQAIRNEIERRMLELARDKYIDPHDTLCRTKELHLLLSFLSTLEESERPEPYNPVYDEAYLNEKIKKATESWKGADVDAMLAECRGYDEEKSEKPINQEGLEEEIVKVCNDFVFPLYGLDDEFGRELMNKIARHFAKWGAEHLKK